MQKFNSLTIYVDYRFDAGNSVPSCKILRARVVCDSVDGPVYGPPITRRSIYDFPTLRTECVKKLHDKVRRLEFEFSALIPPSVYRECITSYEIAA